jgi:hypothetical protein
MTKNALTNKHPQNRNQTAKAHRHCPLPLCGINVRCRVDENTKAANILPYYTFSTFKTINRNTLIEEDVFYVECPGLSFSSSTWSMKQKRKKLKNEKNEKERKRRASLPRERTTERRQLLEIGHPRAQ